MKVNKYDDMHTAREVALSVWSECFRYLIHVMKEKYYPNDEERAQFAEDVIADLSNSEYQLYTKMCDPPPHNGADSRKIVIGRKDFSKKM